MINAELFTVNSYGASEASGSFPDQSSGDKVARWFCCLGATKIDSKTTPLSKVQARPRNSLANFSAESELSTGVFSSRSAPKRHKTPTGCKSCRVAVKSFQLAIAEIRTLSANFGTIAAPLRPPHLALNLFAGNKNLAEPLSINYSRKNDTLYPRPLFRVLP